MFQLEIQPRFKEDLRRLLKVNRIEKRDVDDLVAFLLSEPELPEAYMEHPLDREWTGCMDAHLDGDIVVIFKRIANEGSGRVVLHRIGRHEDVFLSWRPTGGE